MSPLPWLSSAGEPDLESLVREFGELRECRRSATPLGAVCKREVSCSLQSSSRTPRRGRGEEREREAAEDEEAGWFIRSKDHVTSNRTVDASVGSCRCCLLSADKRLGASRGRPLAREEGRCRGRAGGEGFPPWRSDMFTRTQDLEKNEC